jgi:hypothetical protein
LSHRGRADASGGNRPGAPRGPLTEALLQTLAGRSTTADKRREQGRLAGPPVGQQRRLSLPAKRPGRADKTADCGVVARGRLSPMRSGSPAHSAARAAPSRPPTPYPQIGRDDDAHGLTIAAGPEGGGRGVQRPVQCSTKTRQATKHPAKPMRRDGGTRRSTRRCGSREDARPSRHQHARLAADVRAVPPARCDGDAASTARGLCEWTCFEGYPGRCRSRSRRSRLANSSGPLWASGSAAGEGVPMGLSSGITPLRTGRELAGVDSTALLDRIERPAQVLTVSSTERPQHCRRHHQHRTRRAQPEKRRPSCRTIKDWR